MAGKEPKKLSIIYILKVLEDKSNSANRYSQQQIIDLVDEEYGMKLDRKTIRSNLSKLLEFGFPLRYEIRLRTNSKGQTENIMTNWYYEHDLKWDESELQVMIDSLLFSNYLPPKQCRDLVKKIAELGNEDMRKRLAKSYNTVQLRPVNKGLFFTISLLSEAIHTKKKVTFHLNHYDTDFKLHPNLDENGEPKLYTVSPYKLLSLNGRYYVLCCREGKDEISSFRMDRITDVKILDTAAEPVSSIKGYGNDINAAQFAAEHPNMWGGELCRCKFSCPTYLMNDVVDWFGDKAVIRSVNDGMMEVSVRVSEKAMHYWAIQYADAVEVLSPQSLREDIGKVLREAAEKYK